MALSTEDAARLASMKAARDRLLKGEAVAEVSSGGRSKKYAQADLAGLEGQIDALEASAVSGRPVRRRGSITFRFR